MQQPASQKRSREEKEGEAVRTPSPAVSRRRARIAKPLRGTEVLEADQSIAPTTPKGELRSERFAKRAKNSTPPALRQEQEEGGIGSGGDGEGRNETQEEEGGRDQLKGRRLRLTEAQFRFLDECSAQDPMLTRERKHLLAGQLSVCPSKVATWFMNKKASLDKGKQLEVAHKELQTQHEALQRENERVKAQYAALQATYLAITVENAQLHRQLFRLTFPVASSAEEEGGEQTTEPQDQPVAGEQSAVRPQLPLQILEDRPADPSLQNDGLDAMCEGTTAGPQEEGPVESEDSEPSEPAAREDGPPEEGSVESSEPLDGDVPGMFNLEDSVQAMGAVPWWGFREVEVAERMGGSAAEPPSLAPLFQELQKGFPPYPQMGDDLELP